MTFLGFFYNYISLMINCQTHFHKNILTFALISVHFWVQFCDLRAEEIFHVLCWLQNFLLMTSISTTVTPTTKHIHNIMLPPPCLTCRVEFFGLSILHSTEVSILFNQIVGPLLHLHTAHGDSDIFLADRSFRSPWFKTCFSVAMDTLVPLLLNDALGWFRIFHFHDLHSGGLTPCFF